MRPETYICGHIVPNDLLWYNIHLRVSTKIMNRILSIILIYFKISERAYGKFQISYQYYCNHDHNLFSQIQCLHCTAFTVLYRVH